MMWSMTTRTAALVLAACLGLSGCSLLGGEDDDEQRGPVRVDPLTSMTEAGVSLAGQSLQDAPRYDIRADVAPSTGRVRGTVRAELPVGPAAPDLELRYFAGVPDFGVDARLGQVTVDGQDVRSRRDDSIVRIPLPDGHDGRVEVTVPFSYVLPPAPEGGGLLDQLGGMGGPADVGLLARHPDELNLGHWFPLWVPEGRSAEPDPGGFGDIGNFPAAVIRAELTVPERWTVVDGGVRVADDVEDGTRTVVSEGYGMNDLVVSVLRGYASRSTTLRGELDGVRVTAYGPRSDRGVLNEVLQETVVAVETLSESLALYPWREFDVVSAPLGSGVGGMEWPGATWIERDLFAGGLPGLGGLADSLGGLDGLGGLLGGEDGDAGGLGSLLGGGETGLVLDTLRAWTIAHEVGHEWWHVVVGNDSVLDPVVDEPLAQHSACLVMRRTHPADADALCSGHVDSAYEQMRLLGDDDAAAARPTDAFASSGQYAGVVYGKAAAFYRTLEDEFGREQVAAALAAVVREHAFEMLDDDQLRDSLARSLGGGARFDRLWTRWMERRHGDADLGVDADAGLGGLLGQGTLDELLGGGAGGQDAGELSDLLGELLAGMGVEGSR
jgi:hypothetical protein